MLAVAALLRIARPARISNQTNEGHVTDVLTIDVSMHTIKS